MGSDITSAIRCKSIRSFSESFITEEINMINLQYFVQKMKVKVNDLDLATTKEGYLKFKSVLKDYFVKEEYVSEKKFKSATYDINGVETEILYYENDKLNMFEQVKIVSWLGLKIPILPLPFALKFYQLIKRENKINLIKEFIKKNDN